LTAFHITALNLNDSCSVLMSACCRCIC